MIGTFSERRPAQDNGLAALTQHDHQLPKVHAKSLIRADQRPGVGVAPRQATTRSILADMGPWRGVISGGMFCHVKTKYLPWKCSSELFVLIVDLVTTTGAAKS
jgi:hypothetical protein